MTCAAFRNYNALDLLKLLCRYDAHKLTGTFVIERGKKLSFVLDSIFNQPDLMSELITRDWLKNPLLNLDEVGKICEWPNELTPAGLSPRLLKERVESVLEKPIADSIMQNNAAYSLTHYDVFVRLGLRLLPDEITEIPDGAFEYFEEDMEFEQDGLDLIRLPPNLKKIGKEAFLNRKSVRFQLPSNIEEIGERAFSGCTNLETETLPYGLKTIERETFKNCHSMPLKDLPRTIEIIRANVFEGCSSMEIKSLPSSLETLERGAFKECTSLKITYLPDVLRTIETETFQYCINMPLKRLPSNIQIIQAYAFNGCARMEIEHLPLSLETIHEGAFLGCTSLKIEAMHKNLDIKTKAFESADLTHLQVEQLELPFRYVEDGAFHLCRIEQNVYQTILASHPNAFKGKLD